MALTYFKIYIAIERTISKNNQPFVIIDNRIYVCYSSKISAYIIMSFLVVNIAAPWQLASENIASLDFFS